MTKCITGSPDRDQNAQRWIEWRESSIADLKKVERSSGVKCPGAICPVRVPKGGIPRAGIPDGATIVVDPRDSKFTAEQLYLVLYPDGDAHWAFGDGQEAPGEVLGRVVGVQVLVLKTQQR